MKEYMVYKTITNKVRYNKMKINKLEINGDNNKGLDSQSFYSLSAPLQIKGKSASVLPSRLFSS